MTAAYGREIVFLVQVLGWWSWRDVSREENENPLAVSSMVVIAPN